MGTQQILLIVLSVIIVGVAIVVGIGMFNRQAYNSNKTAIASDAQTYASEVVQFFKTPLSQGGAMGTSGVDTTVFTVANIAAQLGIGTTAATAIPLGNENGKYYVSAASATSVTILGLGNAERNGVRPTISTVITLPAGTIVTTPSDTAAWTAS